MKNAGKIAAVLSMGMALSAVCGMNAFAADKAFQLDVTNWTDEDWNSIAMTNDDTVTSGAVIRSDASADSDAVGYLYRGAAVQVLDKGDSWTEIQSGKVTGYVRNDFLVFGTEAKGLAEYYGKEGVVANWNDVKVFADKNASDVSKTVSDGTAFPLVSDEGHWLLVQQGADSAGYVSEEDASRMLLVDTAVPADGEDEVSSYVQNLGGTEATQSTDAADTDTDSSVSDETDAGQDESSDGSYEEGSSDADSSQTDSSAQDAGSGEEDGGSAASWDAGTSYSSGTQDSSADGSGTDEASAPQAETYQTQTVSSDPDVQSLYDAYIAAQNAAMNCTSEQDAKDKALAAVTAYNAYVAAANGSASSASQSTEGSSSGTDVSAQTEAPAQTNETASYDSSQTQTEAAQTEAVQQTPASSASSGSTGSYADYSDLDLLAAIIWCEAGNQPYDGMVAVGEVVMNRVASPSFPNTVAEVLEQPGQFTPYSSGTLQSALAAGVNSTCYQAAQDALNGAQPVPGALYFNTHSGTTKLGAHYFS